MAVVDTGRRSIECKIVYVGPSLGGKTTNLRSLQAQLPESQRSPLQSIEDAERRTIFFDYLPLEHPPIGGFSVRFRLYTVAGQDRYRGARESVLNGADGIVVVIDSQPSRAIANRDSLDGLVEHFRSLGKQFGEIPTVLQYNKADLPDALGQSELDRLLNPLGLPSVRAVAVRGEGVAETLATVSRLVVRNL